MVVCALALLRLFGPFPLYYQVLKLWGVKAWATPFLDTDTVLSAVRCLREGVDVFATNPCDPLQRVYDYSPLWLLLAALPFTPNWTTPAGILVDAAFLLSLALLPRPTDRRGMLIAVAGALSSATIFAIERGNNDLVLFALAAAAAALALRSPAARMLGYGCALLAGLLKYYPMALLALALRDAPRLCIAIYLATVAIIALFLVVMGDDLVRALHLIPTGIWYGDMFGASTLPGGLAEWFGWPAGVAFGLRVVLSAGALGGGLALARTSAFADAIQGLTPRERSFLLAGALMVIACFMTAQNIGYRAALLLLALPSLAALRSLDRRHWWASAPYIALALLWSIGWRHWIEQSANVGIARAGLVRAGWLLREPLWWAMIVILAGCAWAILLRAPSVRALLAGSPLRALLPPIRGGQGESDELSGAPTT